MSTDEERFARWLHDHTPQPPRPLELDQLVPQMPSPRARWSRALAAAATVFVVAAVVAGIVAVRHSTHRQNAAAPTSTYLPKPSHVPRSRPPSTSSTPTTTTVNTPWGGSVVTGPASHAVPLLAASGSLYAIDQSTLYRLDAASGAVLAQADVDDARPGDAVIAGGALWLSPNNDISSTGGASKNLITQLTGYDLTTLKPSRHVNLAEPTGRNLPPQVPIAAPASGNRLYATSGNTIVVINPNTNKVVHKLTLAGDSLADVAVSPDGATLYAAQDQPDLMLGKLTELDPDTGEVRASTQAEQSIDVGIGLVASAGGVWVHSSGGMEDQVRFYAGHGLVLSGPHPDPGIQSRPLSITVSNNTVWLGTYGAAACANTENGEVRQSIEVPNVDGSSVGLINLQDGSGTLYGYYQHDDVGVLIRVKTPSKCTS